MPYLIKADGTKTESETEIVKQGADYKKQLYTEKTQQILI